MTAEATAEYMDQQRQWLEKTVRSKAYKSALYRIVLAHEAPHSHRPSRINEFARFIFEPLRKAADPVHLCLTGHIHRYRRTIPNSTAAYGNAPVKPDEMRRGKDYPFTIVTVEGPGKNSALDCSATIVKVNANGIEVKTYDEQCRCFDHFVITSDGGITEKKNLYKQEMLKLYPGQGPQ